jgi:hypothetical protein
MIDSLIIVIGLTILNFAVFLALVISLIRSRNRDRGASFKFTPVEGSLDETRIADKDLAMYDDSKIAREAISAMTEAKSDSMGAKSDRESQKHPHEREKVTVG